ncbi:MAG: hypothetical protein IT385_27175 [Deltaproteobacteria bacterium]|nr:hypothetical protein [Deltaproteobacteria bacterium]
MARRPSDLTTRTIVPALVLALASGCFAANARVELTREVTRVERVLPDRLGAGALTNVRADGVTVVKHDGKKEHVGPGRVSVADGRVVVAAVPGLEVKHSADGATVASVDLSHRMMDARLLPIAAEAKQSDPVAGVLLGVILVVGSLGSALLLAWAENMH